MQFVIPTNWATGSVQTLISKWGGVQCSYQLNISADGHLSFSYTTDGTTQRTIQSVAALLSTVTGVTTTSGLPVWLRVYATPNNGSSQASASFTYSQVLSPGPSDWILIDTVTNVNFGSWFSSTSNVYLGQVPAGTQTFTGRMYEAQIYNDTTPVASFDARSAKTPPSTFTDTQGKVWTPLASASLISDEISDWDFRDKTIRFSRVIGGPAGISPAMGIPIAAADRSEDVKEACESAGGFRCDGAGDEVEIQAALDALNAITKPTLVKFSGGVVNLVGQKFVINTGIHGYSGQKLKGHGVVEHRNYSKSYLLR